MKKILTLALLLLPILTIAQNAGKISIEEYIAKYSKVQGYNAINLNKQLLRQLEPTDEIDNETQKLLSNLKFIRILEYKPKKASESASVVAVSSRSAINIHRTSPNIVFIDGIVDRPGRKALSEIDLSNFVQIVGPDKNSNKILFRKKNFGSRQNEYLLLSGPKTVVNLKGKFEIDNCEEIEKISEVALSNNQINK